MKILFKNSLVLEVNNINDNINVTNVVIKATRRWFSILFEYNNIIITPIKGKQQINNNNTSFSFYFYLTKYLYYVWIELNDHEYYYSSELKSLLSTIPAHTSYLIFYSYYLFILYYII